jgi:hypothetical protein
MIKLSLSFQEKMFTYVIYSSYILYFIVLFGLSTQAPKYLDLLEIFIKIYVSLFLLIRFNPFRHVKFTDLDRRIAFSAGLFIFTTSVINEIIMHYVDVIKNNIKNKLHTKNNTQNNTDVNANK